MRNKRLDELQELNANIVFAGTEMKGITVELDSG
jgi:hypothetical protein